MVLNNTCECIHTLCKNAYGLVYIHIYIHIHMYIYICIHAYIDIYIHTYTYTYIYAWIYIYIHMHIMYIHIYVYIYAYAHMYIYISTTRACASVQQCSSFLGRNPCHGSYCELILSLARISCRLSFPPALLPLRRAGRPPAGSCPTCSLDNPSKPTLAHDAVAAVVLHKHHLIILVGAGLIKFV